MIKKKSKRSEIKGRSCSTFKVPQLLEIEKKLKIKIGDSKKYRYYICDEIEIYLRIMNKEKKEKIWFLDMTSTDSSINDH